MKTIEVDDELYSYIASHTKHIGESASDILRRMLKFSAASQPAAPVNGASIGGLKVMTDNGWFAARPSGTEDAYKIYCESFLGEEHRKQIEKEAVEIVSEVLKNA